MATQKADVGNDFAAVLSRAQAVPESASAGRDLPDGFPFAHQGHYKVVEGNDEDPRAIHGTVKYPAKIHRRVFTLWRDWASCSRCKDDIANGTVVLPPVGDYECPHNNKGEYEAVCNDILAGRLLMGSEQEVVQRDGSIVISLRWYERVPTKAERRALAKARAIGGPLEEPPL